MTAKIPLAAALLLAAALPAAADAVTWEGTLGTLPIGVELATDPGEAPVFGRYFYAHKGIDIPLHALERGDTLVLQEELPCTAGTCAMDENGNLLDPLPLGATWTLALSADGTRLAGTWRDGDRSLPLALERRGDRPFAIMPETTIGDLAQIASMAAREGGTLPAAFLPYETLKMSLGRLEPGEPVAMGGSSFRYVTDPRTGFAFPRIVALADGADPGPANAALEARHWALNADALDCAAMQYAAFGWSEWNAAAAGSLGGYEDEQVTVTYLSPRVMSITESGSLFCGGAHPYNHMSTANLDVAAGTPLDLVELFTFWVPMQGGVVIEDLAEARAHPEAYRWGPAPVFADFLRERRTRWDADFEAECGIDELIPDYLAVGFGEGDRVVFALDTLPHVMQACADRLYEAPIAELGDWLAPGAAAYFPSLAE